MLLYYDKNDGNYIIGSPSCYKISLNTTINGSSTSGRNITISVDCFNYLCDINGHVAVFQVYSVPAQNSSLPAWYSHIMIDSLPRGLPIGESTETI